MLGKVTKSFQRQCLLAIKVTRDARQGLPDKRCLEVGAVVQVALWLDGQALDEVTWCTKNIAQIVHMSPIQSDLWHGAPC